MKLFYLFQYDSEGWGRGRGYGSEQVTVTEERYAKHEVKDEKQLSQLHSQPSPVLSESAVSPVWSFQLLFLTCFALFLPPLFSACPSLTRGLQFSRDITALVRRETELTNLFLPLIHTLFFP